VGPAAIVQASRFINDSRDKGSEERLTLLAEQDGVWGCQAFMSCTMACPRGIPVSRKIADIKQSLRLREMP
jgi:succinate dehydrogenase / fumarate reductase iron-sulfur subunit